MRGRKRLALGALCLLIAFPLLMQAPVVMRYALTPETPGGEMGKAPSPETRPLSAQSDRRLISSPTPSEELFTRAKEMKNKSEFVRKSEMSEEPVTTQRASKKITTVAPTPNPTTTTKTQPTTQLTTVRMSTIEKPPPGCDQDVWARECAKGDAPLVFALMITGKDTKHAPLARLSVRSFLEQDHPSRVLIIINDGSIALKNDANIQNNPCVCEHMLPKVPTRKLGQLRNIAMRHVPRGGVWVQWDDDDWRARGCMRGQVGDMQKKKADIVFMQRQIHVDMLWNSTFKYEYGDWGIWGTIMVNTSHKAAAGMTLPNVDKGEDLHYDALRGALKAVVWDNPPEMYFRIIHGHNTWERAHFRPKIRFRRNTWCLRMPSCPPHVQQQTRTMFTLYRQAIGLPQSRNATASPH